MVVVLYKLFSVINAPPRQWEECKYQRSDVWELWKSVLDVGRNGVIDKNECITYMNELIKRRVTTTFSSVRDSYTKKECDKMFSMCDFNKDGIIDEDDFKKSHLTCINDCDSATKSMMIFKTLTLDIPRK